MRNKNQRVINWVLVLCLLVLMMLVIGAITRLTGSGLSIVEWKPLMGAIPPLTETDWHEVFEKYKSSPQYQLVNRGMSLAEFQWIFFWEYFHRLVARLMGLIFLIPWLFFWWKGYFGKKRAFRLLGGFLLGGLQGVMGWIMVASGLVNQPQVSHYRLAMHLMLALLILAYFWRLIWDFYLEGQGLDHFATEKKLEVKNLSESKTIIQIQSLINGTLILLLVQIFYGALGE